MKNRYKFTNEQIEWLEENCRGTYVKELTKKFNERFSTNLKEKQIEKMKERYGLKSGLKSKYTQAQLDWMKQNFANGTSKELVAEYNKKFNTNYSLRNLCTQAGRMGLVKRKTYKIGSEIERKDGYVYVKVSPKKWIPKQRYIYEKHYGKIPRDYVVVFLDKNARNFDIDNLSIAPKSIAFTAINHGWTSDDKEVTKTGLLLAELTIETKKLERVKKDEII